MNQLGIGPCRVHPTYIYLIFICLFCFTGNINAQLPIASDSLYQFIKAQSAYSKTTDWTSIDSLFTAQLASSKTADDSLQCFVTVFKAIGDGKSQIRFKGKTYQHAPSLKASEQQAAALLKGDNRSAETIIRSMFMQTYGYLRIQGSAVKNKEEADKLAQMIYDSISHFSPDHTRGFILDLRLLNAGNNYSTLAGLSPFFEDGPVLKELSSEGRADKSWKIKDANLLIDSTVVSSIRSNISTGFRTKPIAVLIGPATSGPGTYAAIAFKRRPNTLIIGEPTASGYSTLLTHFGFGDIMDLELATRFIADRSSTIYPETISPDLFVQRGDQFDRLLSDKKIKEALYWLMKQ